MRVWHRLNPPDLRHGRWTSCAATACTPAAPRPPPKRCPDCGSPRILAHEELFALSIAHVDCDAFYASVEKRDHPELRDKPLIVGGGTRGVVSTCCYIARQYGVHSAMPSATARRLCPDAVFIRPDMKKYVAVSRQIRERMEALTPLVEPLSIDEAFLDLSGTEGVHKAPPAEVLARFATRHRDRNRRDGVGRAEPQQVPRQDRLRSRQAARLRRHRQGGNAGFPGAEAGRA